jgi:uncharacterized membrane protein YfcA
MDLVFILTLLLIAFFVGIIGSMLGVGGGVILIPILTLGLKISVHTAVGTSIVAVIATSCAAAFFYIGERITNIRLGMLLEVATTTGGIAGALIAVIINPQLLAVLFGAVLVYASIYVILKREENGIHQSEVGSDRSKKMRLSSGYYDEALQTQVGYHVQRIPEGILASFLAGNISGLFGVGGGIVKVPVMNLIMKIPMKAVVATSNFMIGVTAAASAYIYYSQGFVNPLITVPVAMGVFLGALIGTRIVGKTKGSVLKLIFGIILAYFAIAMLINVLGVTIFPSI